MSESTYRNGSGRSVHENPVGIGQRGTCRVIREGDFDVHFLVFETGIILGRESVSERAERECERIGRNTEMSECFRIGNEHHLSFDREG